MMAPSVPWIESPAQHSHRFGRQVPFLTSLLHSQLTDTEQFLSSFIPTPAKLFRDGMFIPTPVHRLFNCNRKRSRVSWNNQNPGLLIDQFEDSAHIRGDHGAAAAEGFDDDVGVSLVVAWQSEHIGCRKPLGNSRR